MNADEIKKAEARAYARGYAAGKKRADEESERRAIQRDIERKTRARRRFRQQAFLAALEGTLMSGKWSNGEVFWKSPSDYAAGCWKIADAAIATNSEDWA